MFDWPHKSANSKMNNEQNVEQVHELQHTSEELPLGRRNVLALVEKHMKKPKRPIGPIDLKNLNLTEIPEALEQLIPRLQRLNLSFNANIRLDRLSKFSNLQQLELKYLQLDNFPNVKHLTKLEKLNLSHNRLKDVPKECIPPSIKILILDCNNIKQFPTFLCDTNPLLEQLMLHQNKIKSIPLEICKLTNLQSLTISKNLLKKDVELQKQMFAKLTKLTFLSFWGNRNLQYLDDSIENLKDLASLLLSDCGLQEIPSKSISKLTKLKCLRLNENFITETALQGD